MNIDKIEAKLSQTIEQHNDIIQRMEEAREEYAQLDQQRLSLVGSVNALSEMVSELKAENTEAPKEDEAEE